MVQYRPVLQQEGTRYVSLDDAAAEMERRSKFSFATMDMLKTDPVTKILFLQVYSNPYPYLSPSSSPLPHSPYPNSYSNRVSAGARAGEAVHHHAEGAGGEHGVP